MKSSSTLQLLLTVLFILFVSLVSHAVFVPKGRKCRLQEMHCDIMHPEKQCCPGTSCGVRRINNNLVNICMMCLDIGESCGKHVQGNCCRGLRCQKITALSSACIPVADFKFYPDYDEIMDFKKTNNRNNNNNHHNNDNFQQHQDEPPISLASLLML